MNKNVVNFTFLLISRNINNVAFDFYKNINIFNRL